jgi:hypothetical protein
VQLLLACLHECCQHVCRSEHRRHHRHQQALRSHLGSFVGPSLCGSSLFMAAAAAAAGRRGGLLQCGWGGGWPAVRLRRGLKQRRVLPSRAACAPLLSPRSPQSQPALLSCPRLCDASSSPTPPGAALIYQERVQMPISCVGRCARSG